MGVVSAMIFPGSDEVETFEGMRLLKGAKEILIWRCGWDQKDAGRILGERLDRERFGLREPFEVVADVVADLLDEYAR